MKRLVTIGFCTVICVIGVCTMLILNELQQIRQAIVENPNQSVVIMKQN